MTMRRNQKTWRLVAVSLALLAVIGHLPSSEASPFHQCLHGCHEEFYNQLEENCYAWYCRYITVCFSYCYEAASWTWQTCVSGCIADHG